MLFEPTKTQKGFHEFLLNSMINKAYDDKSPMGNVAQFMVADTIKAWLVGLDKEVNQVLPRAIEWLDRAIFLDEDFGDHRNFHRLTLHWARAVGVWMLTSSIAPPDWELIRQYSDKALADGNAYTPNLIDRDRLDDYMAFCILARQYEVGIAEYEKYYGQREFSKRATLAARDVGYLICRQRLLQGIDEIELLSITRKMLQSKLEKDWIGRGQTIRAATWLLAVYECQVPRLTPLQTILLAYENMPRVNRPEFLSS